MNQIVSTPQLPSDQAIPPRLKAGPAFAILALFIVTQILTGIIVGFTIAIVAVLQGSNLKDPQVLAQITQQATPLSVIAGFLIASIIALYISNRWFSEDLKDSGFTGAAWKIGTLKFILLGLGTGALIALGYLFLSPLMSNPPDENAIGPFARMATTPGFQQMLALFIALILAPPVEELLFRGVIFGGISRSFGVIWSAIITTFLFVASHVIEAVHFWPTFVFIALMASAALWFRLYTRAIGPSIALHFTYNLVIFGVALLA